jgi:amidase
VDDADLIFCGPRTLAAKIAVGEVSAREVVAASLSRIERVNPLLNAFRVTLAEEALAAAEELDARPREQVRGRLAGVPLAVKDDMPVAGQRMTRGSRSPAPVEPVDAEVIQRFRAAGAIPIGITNVPEMMLFPWTATAANGITRNPWNLERTPGGSSGGSAAAVAAGMVPMATASDGGGSIRIPAACCGLVGMKPSRGRVSAQPYGPGWLGLATFGALARTVADSAFLLDTIHGILPGDGEPAAAPLGTFLQAALTEPVRPLRIAISRKLPAGTLARLSADQRRAWDQTARLLEQLGHTLEERDPDYGAVGPEFIQTYLRAAHEEVSALADTSVIERSTRQLGRIGGRVVSAGRRDKLLARRAAATARIGRLWDDFDLLLTPGLAMTAIKAEGAYGKSAPVALNTSAGFMPWFPTWNLTGQPAISLPAGFDAAGLPLSVQLVGRHGGEETLYAIAGQIEAARPWAPDRPPTG